MSAPRRPLSLARLRLVLAASGVAFVAACHSSNAPKPNAPPPRAVEPADERRGVEGGSGSALAGRVQEGSDEVGSHLAAAVANPERPPEDRVRDADRHPAQILSFFGVEPGMTALDLMAGRGYYTELLARAVGSDGRVFCHNSPFVLKRFAEQPLSERLGRRGLEAVVRVDQDLDALELEAASVDVAVMVLFYHDTYWQKVDRARMNRLLFAAVRPGGVYGIIDHHARVDSGARDVKSLHRVEARLVREEVEAAGFVFEEETDLLSVPADDRTQNVFSEGVRGKTDRFVFRFRRPG